MSTNTIFSYSKHSPNNDNSNQLIESDNEEDNNDKDYEENLEIDQLNRLDRPKTKGKTGVVIPSTSDNYEAAIALKKEKKLARESAKELLKIQSTGEPITKVTEQKPNVNNKQNIDNQNESTLDVDQKTRKLSKSEVSKIIEQETEKPQTLKTVEEVYNRIRFECQDKLSNFSITFEDGQTKPFRFLSPKKISTITEIKYKNNIIWSKLQKIYNFSLID